MCAAAAGLLTLALAPVLHGSATLLLVLPVVTLAAVRGGLIGAAPSVVTGLTCVILDAPHPGLARSGVGLPFATFLLSSGLVVTLACGLRSALARLSAREAELDANSATMTSSEALRRAILESSTDYAIISMDREGLITSWNAGAVRIMGWTEAEMIGRPAHVVFTAEEVASGAPEREMIAALRTGRGDDERFHLRRDGSRFWASGLMTPMRAEGGAAVGFLKILRDRTAEHEAQQALERSEAQLRLERSTLEAIFHSAPVGLSLSAAVDGRSILANAELQRILGRNISGDDWERYDGAGAVHPDGTAYAVDDYPSVRALRQGEATRSQTFVVVRPDGTRLRTEASSSPLHDASGAVVAAVTVVVDVEAREQAIEHQKLLMSELGHRMKNTMSMVQAIVSQTLRSAASADAARAEIMERLGALSRAQDALGRTRWSSAALADTVDAALLPLALGPDRLSVQGPQVRVGSRAALSFTLALHELATNAVKYGALSAPGGRVEISWTMTPGERGELLTFLWSERGGPPVQPPAHKGFGSRLLDSVSRTFSGESTLIYDPAGVGWKVTAAAEALQAF